MSFPQGRFVQDWGVALAHWVAPAPPGKPGCRTEGGACWPSPVLLVAEAVTVDEVDTVARLLGGDTAQVP